MNGQGRDAASHSTCVPPGSLDRGPASNIGQLTDVLQCNLHEDCPASTVKHPEERDMLLSLDGGTA